MQLPALFLASVLFAPTAVVGHAQLFGGHHGHHNHPHPARPASGGTVFPFLTWLRDSAVELIFGPPAGRATAGADASPYSGSSMYAQYANEIVIRFNVTAEEEERALAEATDRLFLDVWAFTTEYVDVRIHKDDISSLLSLLPKDLASSYSTLIPELSAAVYTTYPSESSQKRDFQALESIDNLFFRDYQPLPVVIRWMRLLESMFPSIVRMESIGKSYEGRDIYALRVGEVDHTKTTKPKHKPRKALVVTGGLHGREWISTSTVNYLAWSFITSYGKEPIITQLLAHLDIVFIPALNPDGIEYTWRSDRLWRKSRQHTNLRFCKGLDLDHAFGYEWDTNEVRKKSDPCSESYGGDLPFQAVEAFELSEWARNQTENHNANFVGLIDLHSYSQQVLFPYSYSCDVDPPNLENLQELAVGISKAIRLSSGEIYKVASACEGAVAQKQDDDDDSTPGSSSRLRIESGGGSAIDWFYHEMKARYSYRIQLRDTGSYGFLLPPEHIVPTGEEMFHAMKYLGDYLLGNNGIEKLAGAGEEYSKAVQQDATEPPQRPMRTASAGGDDEDDDEEWLELRRRRRMRR
ncbi:ECM14-like protein [Pleurostoma richardsiae]|uniref:Inactive metallocarboxypeptidase ECM14 n=1 Tax=Pleurostoma richardsiae TaxID=41990 RepID=A0AA38VH57_9PEZI|nr:ECM14-like protein [Pleurostoma richardsiae]